MNSCLLHLALTFFVTQAGICVHAEGNNFASHGWSLHEISPEGNAEVRVGGFSTCDGVNEGAEHVAHWTQRLGETPGKKSLCRCDEKKKICGVDLTATAPALTRVLNQGSPRLNGPNCFNTSLVVSKILPNLLFTSPEEMGFLLSSPLCRPVPNSLVEAGDIEVIRRASDHFPIHSFIWIDSNFSFSKGDSSKTAAYHLGESYFEYSPYKIPNKCRETDLADHQALPQGCLNYSSIYHCQPLDSYLKQIPKPSMSYIKDQFTQEQLERQISELTFHSPQAPDQKFQGDLLSQLLTLANDAKIHAEDKNFSESEKFLWRALELRADSATQQIQQWNQE